MERQQREYKYDQDVQRRYEQALRERCQEEVYRQAQYAPPVMPNYDSSSTFKVNGSGTFYSKTSTGNPDSFNTRHGGEVTSILTKHGNGFFSDIRICHDDWIRFKLFRGGLIAYALHKLGWREPRDIDGNEVGWANIPNQNNNNQKLEVQLGKTFLKIDDMIAGEMEAEEHEGFIREMAKTDPENLKMIAGLKTLDDGMKSAVDPPDLNGITTQKTVTPPNNAGAIGWKLDTKSNEIMKIDHNDNISFSDKMAAAIKKVSEVNESKAP